MLFINAEAKPNERNEYYGKVAGAFVTLYIDYKDVDGAFELAKFYIESEGWTAIKIEEEYFVLDSKNDVEKDQHQYYDEAKEIGYSMLFNQYVSDDD